MASTPVAWKAQSVTARVTRSATTTPTPVVPRTVARSCRFSSNRTLLTQDEKPGFGRVFHLLRVEGLLLQDDRGLGPGHDSHGIRSNPLVRLALRCRHRDTVWPACCPSWASARAARPSSGFAPDGSASTVS